MGTYRKECYSCSRCTRNSHLSGTPFARWSSTKLIEASTKIESWSMHLSTKHKLNYCLAVAQLFLNNKKRQGLREYSNKKKNNGGGEGKGSQNEPIPRNNNALTHRKCYIIPNYRLILKPVFWFVLHHQGQNMVSKSPNEVEEELHHLNRCRQNLLIYSVASLL